ncbi:MerR family transcriptional regulator [Pseudonocardia sp. KRD-184]|uniref:MerR family transcriptional regulator n=1 Tax=Pseudonocardia oceani TaxID=2792013 RepID=A0ABS6U3X1_9PSEU|nr:MerR family transcriptional regulator [Pseudonocardia oceani]MBW0092253.1 MerR family transcriptional regulator [Pseudonocardia oceani]MBW0099232.1 MerR family transcriptional regulator [Pseudonocardia oceani]MBW0108419.1 MerR family transcriptional regulator [Pseudonocardia oceani]MBW0125391.1 MerR family transcriptional regulator [Pseudonocardia oceani]MBW0126942.1 MerR family transcriptional regulator [Pseudonocardia oceani]
MTAEGPGQAPSPLWTAGAVARQIGVAPSTLRSWSRRHGLSATGHRDGTHRRYTEQDVAVLEAVRRHVGEGVPVAVAAGIARGSAAQAAPVPAGAPAPPRRPITQALVRGALRLDADAVLDTLTAALGAEGVFAVWERSCVPALRSVGRRAGADEACIGAEHLLSWCVTTALHRHSARHGSRTGPSGASPRVLLACTDGERHHLGLDALHAALAERGVAATVFGASLPAPAVVAAARARPTDVVVLWSQAARTGRPGVLRALLPAAGSVLAAGPGWGGSRLPAGTAHVTSLGGAVDAVLAAHPLAVAGG